MPDIGMPVTTTGAAAIPPGSRQSSRILQERINAEQAQRAERAAATGDVTSTPPVGGMETRQAPAAVNPQADARAAQGAYQLWNSQRGERAKAAGGSLVSDIQNSLPEKEKADKGEYTVKPGDTLGEIAAALKEKYGLTQSKKEIMAALKAENNLADINKIKTGQKLKIGETIGKLQQSQTGTPAGPPAETTGRQGTDQPPAPPVSEQPPVPPVEPPPRPAVRPPAGGTPRILEANEQVEEPPLPSQGPRVISV